MGMKRKTENGSPPGMLSDSYRMLFESMTEGVFYQMDNGNLVEVNPAALHIFGLKKEEFIGRNSYSEQWDVILEDKTPCPMEKHPSWLALKTGEPVMHQVLAVRNATTKQYVWVVVNALPQFRKGETKPYCVMVTLHDIMWRKREEVIAKARLKVLEYASGHVLDDLLTAILDELEELTESTIGFYHFLEADQQTITLRAWSTRTMKTYCSAKVKNRQYPLSEAGVWVDCVHQRHPVIHNDFQTLAHRKGMPAGHASVTRELVAPVLRGDKIVAILGVGNKPTHYTAEDVGIVSRFADMAWDIAENKRAEEEFLQKAAKFVEIFESAGDGVIYLNNLGIILDVNNALCSITGIPKDTFIGNNVLTVVRKFLDEKKLPDVLSKIQSLLSGTLIEPFDIIFQGRFLEINASLNSQSGHITGIIRDVSEKRKVEDALKHNEQKLSTLISNLPGFVYRCANDRNWTMEFISDGCKEITGYAPEDFLNNNKLTYNDIIHSDYQAPLYLKWQSLLKERKTFEDEYPIITADGEARWVWERGRGFFSEEGTLLHLEGFITDITLRKTSEEALNQKIEELEHFSELTVGRELVMIELKKEVNALLRKTGEAEKYRIVE